MLWFPPVKHLVRVRFMPYGTVVPAYFTVQLPMQLKVMDDAYADPRTLGFRVSVLSTVSLCRIQTAIMEETVASVLVHIFGMGVPANRTAQLSTLLIAVMDCVLVTLGMSGFRESAREVAVLFQMRMAMMV